MKKDGNNHLKGGSSKYRFQNAIELIRQKEFIILKPKSPARKNWEAAFKKMHENGDDKLIISELFDQENKL